MANTQQPDNHVPLPEDLARAIEAGQNRVTTMELEHKRFVGLIGGMKNEIQHLLEEKAYLETGIADNKVKNEKLIADISEAKTQKEALSREVMGLRREMNDMAETRERVRALNEEESKSLTAGRKLLEEKEAKFIVDFNAFNQEQADFTAKVNKLRSVVKEL